MEKVATVENGWTVTMRWGARLLALAVTALFAYAASEFGSGIFPALSWEPQGWPLLFGLLMALSGLWIAWRWELAGGLMAVAGGVLVMVLVCAGSGVDMLFCALLFAMPILAAGGLYLACCWRSALAAACER